MNIELIFAFFGGVMLLQLIHAIAHFLIFRKPAFLYYAIFLIFLTAGQVFRWKVYNNAIPFFSKNSPLWAFDMLMFQLSGIAYTSFLLQFTNAQETKGRFYKYCKITIKLLLFLIFLSSPVFFSSNAPGLKLYYLRIYYLLILPFYFYILWLLHKKKSIISNLILAGTLIMVVPTRIYFIIKFYLEENYDIYQHDFHAMLIGAQLTSFLLINIALIFTARYFQDEKKQFELKKQQEIEAQRQQISNDLHDDAGATLSGLYVFAKVASGQSEQDYPETLKYLGKIKTGIKRVQDKLSAVISSRDENTESEQEQLFPNLIPFEELFKTKSIKFSYHFSIEFLIFLNQFTELKALHLIVQEALNNVLKHSKASKIEIEGKITALGMELNIIDNGKGFDPKTSTKGTGLVSMQQRTAQLGGLIHIQSSESEGTLIQLQIPSA